MAVVGGVQVAASVAVAGLLWLAPQPVALAEVRGFSLVGGADGVAGGGADAVGRQAHDRGCRPAVVGVQGGPPAAG